MAEQWACLSWAESSSHSCSNSFKSWKVFVFYCLVLKLDFLLQFVWISFHCWALVWSIVNNMNHKKSSLLTFPSCFLNPVMILTPKILQCLLVFCFFFKVMYAIGDNAHCIKKITQLSLQEIPYYFANHMLTYKQVKLASKSNTQLIQKVDMKQDQSTWRWHGL